MKPYKWVILIFAVTLTVIMAFNASHSVRQANLMRDKAEAIYAEFEKGNIHEVEITVTGKINDGWNNMPSFLKAIVSQSGQNLFEPWTFSISNKTSPGKDFDVNLMNHLPETRIEGTTLYIDNVSGEFPKVIAGPLTKYTVHYEGKTITRHLY